MPNTQHLSAGIIWKACAERAQQAHLEGNLAQAEEDYRMSVSFAQHMRGETHEDVGEALINLGDFYMSTQQYQQAEETYREALGVYEVLFGKDNLVVAMIYRVLAENYLAQDRTREAELLTKRSTEIFTQRHAS